MSSDRKRQVISIGAAVILHIAVLTFAGMNQHDYETTSEFGPITVEISYDKPPVSKPPEPEAEQVNEFEAEEAPPVELKAPEPIPAADPKPKIDPVPVPEVAAVVPPVSAPRSYAPVAVDDSFLETLKQRSSSGGVDARAVFGDDAVPSSTDRPDAPTASGAQDESEVVLSDSQPARVRTTQPEPEVPSERSVIEAGVLSSLDRQLSTGSSAISEDENDSSAIFTAERSVVPAADVSGQSKTLTFNNPALSRELKRWGDPEIPVEIQTAGISKYTVVIEFDIDPNGITSGFTVKQPSSDTRIDAAVQEALRKWLFAESKLLVEKKVRATLKYVIDLTK